MARSILSLSLVGALALGACKSADGPKPDATPLSLNVAASPMTGRNAIVSGDSLYVCDFTLNFSVSGGHPGETITFVGGVVNFSLDGTAQPRPLEITTGGAILTSDFFTAIFGASGLSAGQPPVSAPLYLAWGSVPVPFNAQLLVRYRVSEPGDSNTSAIQIATAALSCQ